VTVTGLDHVQLAMPPDGEGEARRFYGQLLGLAEIPKPAPLATRGGCWFAAPGTEVHLGVQPDFVPARKAHPAFRVADLDALAARLTAAQVPVTWDQALPQVRRFYAPDPFGNRLEFLQEGQGIRQRREAGEAHLESPEAGEGG